MQKIHACPNDCILYRGAYKDLNACPDVRAEVKNFFEGVKAKKHPPPEEKVNPVKAKRTLDALKKPPKSSPKGNYERIIAKKFVKAERSGSTVSDQRLKER